MLPFREFPGYFYNPENGSVFGPRKGETVELKPYVYPKHGYLRYSFYRRGNPHYIMEHAIRFDSEKKEAWVAVGDRVKKEKPAKSLSDKDLGEVLTKTLDKTSQDDEGWNRSNFKSNDQEAFEKFFKDRDNQMIRKDALVKKFNKALVEEYEFLFNIEKIKGASYYSLK